MSVAQRRAVFGWVMYDWANSAFATTVMAAFFPIFFNEYWSAGADTNLTTARLGLANAAAGIAVAVLAPFLGALADREGARKRFLLMFAFTGILMTGSLYLVSKGDWQAAVVIYVLGSVGFSGGMIFYDSLIKSVATAERSDFVSSLGYALGYLGGGILFALNVWMTLDPSRFGLRDASSAVRFSFITVAAWWTVFTIPLALFVKEQKSAAPGGSKGRMRDCVRELARTFREIRLFKPVFLFLLAYWLYIDGVDTIVRMAVDYGLSIGLRRNDLITALLITQFIGFPSALAFGYMGGKIGAGRAIPGAIAVYLAISVWAAFISGRNEFYVMAAVIGLVQGGIQALSRSYFSRMIPVERAAEFFGFYNMVGKFAAVIGPALIGCAGLLARRAGMDSDAATRISISSISLLFIAGGAVFVIAGRQHPERSVIS